MCSSIKEEKALVLSSQFSHAILPEFDKPFKIFTFVLNISESDAEAHNEGKLIIKIKQDWRHIGVAGVVWESAEVLSNYLIANSGLIRNKNVLELGAGTGLCSIVASNLKAKKVIATDRASVLHVLEENIDLNWNQGKGQDQIAGELTADILEWTQPKKFQRKFVPDVIIGADLVYIQDLFPALIETLKFFAAMSEIGIYFCSKMRYSRDYLFYELVETHHFQVDLIHSVESLNINIYRIKKEVK